MRALALLVLILALLPLVYYVVSLACVIGYFRGARKAALPQESFLPPASILKPVRGLDHEAYENFASFCRLDYPVYEILFAVSDPGDPVVATIEKLRADFPAVPIRLITDVPYVGTSDKVNNLCQLARTAAYDLLVMSDSDVRVEPGYLRKVVAPFADPRVGAVTALYRSRSAGNLASNLDALGMYMDSAPAALVARKMEGRVGFAFGWTMATSKKRLAEIGGWEGMVNHHSEDFELGKRIAERGHQVVLIPEPVSMIFSKEKFAEYFHRELRWSIALKSARPSGYKALVLTQGLPLALLGAAICVAFRLPLLALAYPFLYLVLRFALTWVTGNWGLRDRQVSKIMWLVPIRDLVSFVAWLAGFFAQKVVWRGLEYRLRNGQLIPISSLPTSRGSFTSPVA